MDGSWRAARRTYRRVREWVLLDAHRLVVAAAVLAVVLGIVSVPDVRGSMAGWSSSSMVSLFGGFVTGNLTLVTVVLSINQLVLSRELRTPDEIRTDMEAALAYRDDVATEVERGDLAAVPGESERDVATAGENETEAVRVTPENVSYFLHLLLRSMLDAVEQFDRETESIESDDRRRAASALATDLKSRITEMDALLTEPDVSLFTALSTILRYDLAAEFNRARWLADAEAPTLSEEAIDALESIQTHVQYLETARQYAKTLYVQAELASLSRLLLYVGFGSISTAVLVVALDSPPAGVAPTLLLSLAITAGMTPLAVLLAYVLRVATVAQRTAAFVPFGTPE